MLEPFFLLNIILIVPHNVLIYSCTSSIKTFISQSISRSIFTDSEQIINSDKTFLVDSVEERIIFVFTSDNTVRQKLQQLFIKEGYEICQPTTIPTTIPIQFPDPDICQPIISEQKELSLITPEIIESMNKKSVLLFSALMRHLNVDSKNLIPAILQKNV